jgi:hypothetical protein
MGPWLVGRWWFGGAPGPAAGAPGGPTGLLGRCPVRGFGVPVPVRHTDPGNPNHPTTPRVDGPLRGRSWTRSLVNWRKQLHRWDVVDVLAWFGAAEAMLGVEQEEAWVRDLTGDGDVESNPGPPVGVGRKPKQGPLEAVSSSSSNRSLDNNGQDVVMGILGKNPRVTPFSEACPVFEVGWDTITSPARSTLVHIPRGAVNVVTEEYVRVLQRFNEEPGWETLHSLWAFPKAVLAPMTRGEVEVEPDGQKGGGKG